MIIARPGGYEGRKEKTMTVRELWNVAPQAHVMIRNLDGSVSEYLGETTTGEKKIENVMPATYPNYPNVLEVRLCR